HMADKLPPGRVRLRPPGEKAVGWVHNSRLRGGECCAIKRGGHSRIENRRVGLAGVRKLTQRRDGAVRLLDTRATARPGALHIGMVVRGPRCNPFLLLSVYQQGRYKGERYDSDSFHFDTTTGLAFPYFSSWR